MTHLHWLFQQGPEVLRGVTRGVSLCGKTQLLRKELTALPDDVNCPRCLELKEKDHVAN
jgi:hypothetical protein